MYVRVTLHLKKHCGEFFVIHLSLDYILGLLIKGPSVPLGSRPGNAPLLRKAGCLMLGGFSGLSPGRRDISGWVAEWSEQRLGARAGFASYQPRDFANLLNLSEPQFLLLYNVDKTPASELCCEVFVHQ